MLSTTRSSAVWLLSTESLGLDSTRTVPNDSSSWSTPDMLALPRASVNRFGNPGALGRPAPDTVPVTPGGNVGVVAIVPPWTWLPVNVDEPRTRRADQSMPCWYWLFS